MSSFNSAHWARMTYLMSPWCVRMVKKVWSNWLSHTHVPLNLILTKIDMNLEWVPRHGLQHQEGTFNSPLKITHEKEGNKRHSAAGVRNKLTRNALSLKWLDRTRVEGTSSACFLLLPSFSPPLWKHTLNRFRPAKIGIWPWRQGRTRNIHKGRCPKKI